MNAKTLLNILKKNKQHYVAVVGIYDGSIARISYVEPSLDGREPHIRSWFFDSDGNGCFCDSVPAFNGDMDLLTVYSLLVEFYDDPECGEEDYPEWH
jgi:hypothetical protein